MRIATHIKLFLAFILILIAGNAFIGTHQINRISKNLKIVVNENFNLLKQINLIIQKQGQKALIMERGIRISEELNFEEVSPVRRNYMLNHSTLLEQGFVRLAGEIDTAIKTTQQMLEAQVQSRALEEPLKYVKAQNLLHFVDKAHYAYNKLAEEILGGISRADYELSLQDVEAIERNEFELARALKGLQKHIESLSREAIIKTDKDKEIALNTFKTSLMASFVLSLLIAFFIIGRISSPLDELTAAARQIGAGNFDVKLKANRRDEVGEVGKAFNTMTEQLAEKNLKLRTQSEMMAENLRITEEQKKDLEKVNKEMDRFVYTVSHDIGAPLMGISWYGNFLQKNEIDHVSEKGKDSIHGIVSSAARLNTLIKDLLALTRLSRIKNPYEKVVVKDIIQGVLDRIEFQITQANAKIVLPDNLPTIVCDRIKMGEVFYNLISNGIKFSAKKGDPIITIGYDDKDDMYTFFVQDNGIGIDQKYHADVFSIFRRLHTQTEYEGSGAGLSIVKTIINDHGGNIWIESREGEGAKFVFTIPKDLTPSEEIIPAA